MLEQMEAEAHADYVLTKLIAVYPDAASKPDGEGRLALDLALSNPLLVGNNRAIQKLVAANPQALSTLNARNRLYPALASAEDADKSRFNLSVTYELLRATPDILLHARCGDEMDE